MNSINSRIKEVRLLLQMSQEEFGKAIGLSKSGISNIENGSREVRDVYISAICTKFNIDSEWLQTGIGEPLLDKAVPLLESFVKYLESIGYCVRFYSSSDGSDSLIELKNNGESAEYTTKEFRLLQSEIQDSVKYQIWKKQKAQKQK